MSSGLAKKPILFGISILKNALTTCGNKKKLLGEMTMFVKTCHRDLKLKTLV